MVVDYYLWFHILAAALLYRLFRTRLNNWESAGLVMAVAIVWELYELVFTDFRFVYGSLERFLKDALMDLAGASAILLIMAIGDKCKR